MADIKTITPDNSGFPSFLDFATLRVEGIKHIAAYSGNLWTDHNLHDPGITMLEALCYVLSDLDYRTRLNFQDLVARDPADTSPDNNFYTPAQILGNNPLTIPDYRKLLVDVNGVRNAWLEPATDIKLSFNCSTGQLQNSPLRENLRQVPLLGLYNVILETDDVYAASYATDACGSNQFALDAVISEVGNRLHSHRNLCEDFNDIIILQDEPISLCLHLELKPTADPDALLTGIFSEIQAFFSPAPAFYTLPQMLAKGHTMDQVMEGRPYDFVNQRTALRNGFIDDGELALITRRTCIHASDLYRIIMGVDGVAGVTRLVMYSKLRTADPNSTDPAEKKFGAGEEWCLHLEPNHRPVIAATQSNVILYKNNLPLYADLSSIAQTYVRNLADYHKSAKDENLLDNLVPKGRYMDLAQYKSIQYEFPITYGIGKAGLPADASAARRAQALQLQAYLLFYDQLLGDYLSQLSHIRPLFALNAGTDDPHSYYSATMTEVPKINELLHYGGALSGNYDAGQALAFPPDGNLHKQYGTLSQRSEAIDYLRQQCANNNVQVNTFQNDDATYSFTISDTENLLLEGLQTYPNALQACLAANDVIYLAANADAYFELNNRGAGQYSFNIIYSGNASTKDITDLYETTVQYQARKDRFMDHLLARFSEDFTDYVLMMYALNGKQNNPAQNILDKAALLEKYPQISANRAQAFDYHAYTGGFPQSGLQQRVYSLMGISQAPVHSLNNFDLVQTQAAWQFSVYLPGDGDQDTPLFTSNYFTSKEAATAGFNELLTLAADIKNYHPYGCGGDEVYGFKVISPDDADTLVIATSCLQFSDACTRDDMMEWLAHFFTGNGHYVQYIVAEEGYYFLFLDDNQQAVLKSSKGYDTDTAAFSAGCDALQAVHDLDNYKVVFREDTADYIVQVTSAQSPAAWPDEASAQQGLQKIWEYFLGKSLYYLEDDTPAYQWQVNYADQPAWQSIASFSTAAQLAPAFYQFLGSAAIESNYTIQHTGDQYFLQVNKTSTDEDNDTVIQRIAQGLQAYADEASAQPAITTTAAAFRHLLQTVSAAVKSVTANIFDFNDPDTGAPLITTVHAIPEGPSRAAHLRSISIACADADGLQVVQPENSCQWVVQITDENEVVLAQSPEQDSEHAAQDLVRKLLLLAQQQLLVYEKRDPVQVYMFEWPAANGAVSTYSLRVWEDEYEAATALLYWILAGTPADVQPMQWGNGSFGFQVQLPTNPPLARSATVYATTDARDQAMAQVQADVNLLRDNLQWQELSGHRYYFQVKDGDDVMLEEAHAYADLDAVRHGFYETVQLGRDQHYYSLVDNDGCSYSFVLNNDAGQLLSIHPHVYLSTVERDAALRRVIAFLQAHGQPITIQKLPGVWRFAWQWLSCCNEPEVALAGTQDLPSEDAASTLAQQVLTLAASAGNYDIANNNGQWQVFLKNGDGRLAVHPPVFSRQWQATQAIQRLVAWAAYTPQVTVSNEPNVYTNDVPYNVNAPLTGRLGYRLWNRDERQATYLPDFKTPAARDTALAALCAEYLHQPPSYTNLETGNTAVLSAPDGFYFQLRSRGQLLWQSVNAYGTAEDAMQAFNAQYVDILDRARDSRHYSAFDGTATHLYLLDKKQKPIAALPVQFASKAAHDDKVQALMAAALAYPIVRDSGQYAFHLYNSTAGLYEWHSTHTFATPAAAMAAFRAFLPGLRYRGNFCVDNYPDACNYKISLANVLLYSNDAFVSKDDKNATVGEDNAWYKLDDFLREIQRGDDIYYRYIDYANGCRYAFRVVNADQYRLARHPHWYQSLEDREQHRLRLACEMHCLEKLYAFVMTAQVDPDLDQLASYFTDPAKLRLDRLWYGLDKMPRQQNWVAVQDPEDGMYYYQLELPAKTGETPVSDMQLPGAAYTKVIWRSVNGYATPCDAQLAEQYFYIYILEMARVAAGYWYSAISGKPCEYTLALKDMNGKVIATAPGIVCEADLETHRNTRVVNAILYPVMESLTGGYQFEINDVQQDGDNFTFDTIWQSELVYDDPDAAFEAVIHTAVLLHNACNYQRLSPDDCGPYGIELTDPAWIMALHPLTYSSRAACEAAINAVKEAISTEGFHLLEHILLRPHEPSLTQTSLQLALSLAEGESSAPLQITATAVFDDNGQFLSALQQATLYRNDNTLVWIDAQQVLVAQAPLPGGSEETDWVGRVQQQLGNQQEGNFTTITTTTPGDPLLPLCEGVDICNNSTGDVHCDLTFLADPYSFQATVVIPSWPKRFQVERFRQFFEDTLQKEAPAHLQLRIIWVGPRDMHRFEADYKNWLSVFASPEEDTGDGVNSCRYQQYLEALITTLTSIRNEYPPAALTETYGQPMLLLDETVIS